ncbi:MAG: hypothetical protein FJX34_06145 [Alphaproteobacteria bacterium]|nr:hypothetical protein [Alphaproteobacteria bacterium]
MKKIFFLLPLLLSSCVGFDRMTCMRPSEYDVNTAQSYYDSFGAVLVSNQEHERLRKKFICNYRAGDQIYIYQTFFNKKYILVRYGQAITYIEE